MKSKYKLENRTMKNSFLIICASVTLFSLGCKNQAPRQFSSVETNAIFPRGEPGPAQNFTGKAWAYGLVASDSTYQMLVGNVYFEPGARSNWHIHPAGQILLVTDGVGYHQIQGQPRQTIRKGDVVRCPPNVRHWHGASPDTGMQQIYILPNTEKGIVEWLNPVTDEVYRAK
jgi:quercetin dioxygenase-like cupin family protein